jgi:hypothetical protein
VVCGVFCGVGTDETDVGIFERCRFEPDFTEVKILKHVNTLFRVVG